MSLDRILGPGCRVIEQRFPRHVYVVISPEYTDDEESKPSVPGPTHLPPPDKP